MVTKWQITIVITDIDGKYDARSLSTDIRDKWLPVSFNIVLNELKVSMVKTVSTEN